MGKATTRWKLPKRELTTLPPTKILMNEAVGKTLPFRPKSLAENIVGLMGAFKALVVLPLRRHSLVVPFSIISGFGGIDSFINLTARDV